MSLVLACLAVGQDHGRVGLRLMYLHMSTYHWGTSTYPPYVHCMWLGLKRIMFINSYPSAATYTYIHMHIKIYKYSRSKIVTLAAHSHLFYTSHTMKVGVFHRREVVLAKYNTSSSSRNLK